MLISKDSQSEIVIKMPWWFRVIAWGELLLGFPFFIGYLPASLADPNSETLIPAGFGLLFILLGIWMAGMTTKVTFDKPPGYITVSRGHCPLFLWFLRTKRISREEAKSAFACVIDHWWDEHSHHEVRVVASSGKEVKLLDGGRYQDVANYLAKRIEDWAKEAVVTN